MAHRLSPSVSAAPSAPSSDPPTGFDVASTDQSLTGDDDHGGDRWTSSLLSGGKDGDCGGGDNVDYDDNEGDKDGDKEDDDGEGDEGSNASSGPPSLGAGGGWSMRWVP